MGPIRRLLVDAPHQQQLEVLAGQTLTRLAESEHLADKGEVVLDESPARWARSSGLWSGAAPREAREGQGRFLTELRPAVALFLRFTGLDRIRDGMPRPRNSSRMCCPWRRPGSTKPGSGLIGLAILAFCRSDFP